MEMGTNFLERDLTIITKKYREVSTIDSGKNITFKNYEKCLKRLCVRLFIVSLFIMCMYATRNNQNVHYNEDSGIIMVCPYEVTL